jgi:hypothetical protein
VNTPHYFFDCFLAYAHRRGVPRSVGKMSIDILKAHVASADPLDKIEHVFDRVIEYIRKNPPPLEPEPIPRVRAQRPVPPPARAIYPVNERPIAAEWLDDYVEVVYDPPSDLSADAQMRSSFENRMAAIDWDYHLHVY